MSSEFKYIRRFLDHIQDAAVILDKELQIVDYNSAYQKLAGISDRELRLRVKGGVKCRDIVPLSICESSCTGISCRQKKQTEHCSHSQLIRSELETRVTVSATPLDDDYVVETYRDVTHEVRTEEQLRLAIERERAVRANLEDEVRIRTLELKQAHAQLVHQEKMSGLGRLVAGIAHELNNPINFVYGNVDFLGQYMDDLLACIDLIDKADVPDSTRATLDEFKKKIEYDFLVEDSRKLIRSIRAGAERTASIVQDLKTFSRTGSGKLQEGDLVSGIETTLNLIAPLLKNRIEVESDVSPDIPKLLCNIAHINQVFMNIFTNAVQAIEGKGTIQVIVRCSEQRDSVTVKILDSGPGISPNVLQKISDPFFTTKDVGEGTGLGLWISENIVRAHGGTLSYENRPREAPLSRSFFP